MTVVTTHDAASLFPGDVPNVRENASRKPLWDSHPVPSATSSSGSATAKLPQSTRQPASAAVGLKRHAVMLEEVSTRSRRVHPEAAQVGVTQPPIGLCFHRVEKRRHPARRRSDGRVGWQRWHGRYPANSASRTLPKNSTFDARGLRARHEGRQKIPVVLTRSEKDAVVSPVAVRNARSIS